MTKLKIVIAGPGAGKTYNLKNEVINSLSGLDRNRYCAVITYTNAATDELRKRISAGIPIPPNVFIGTIHSFLIRFVIEPYGHLLKLVPIDKNYIDNIKSREPKQRNAIQKYLSDLGVITFDKVLQLAKELIKNRSIRWVFVNRIQFLFIDEYQDSKNNTHEFFLKIVEEINESFFIGDKLQYIYEFANRRKRKDKSLSVSSLVDMCNKYQGNIERIQSNYRSSNAIVQIVNNFIIDKGDRQKAENGDNGIPVYFVHTTNSLNIITRYNGIKEKHNINELHKYNLNKSPKPFLRDFILTKDWIDNENPNKAKYQSIFNSLNGEFIRLEKGTHRIDGILPEVSRCILAIMGIKKRDFIRSPYDELEYRRYCFETARYLKANVFKNDDDRNNSIRKQFQEKFNISPDKLGKQVDVEKALIELSNNNSINLIRYPESCYSSIHSAKGLEATAVLAIAYSNNELEKWLNFDAANKELDDDYRLGYVAFSRARDLLCIACLEDISKALRDKMESLGIAFYSQNI